VVAVTGTVDELAAEVRRLSELLDRALRVLREAGADHAEAEHVYRLRRGEGWAKTAGRGLVVPERDAMVDALTADERRTRDLAAALEKSALEAVRARRQQLSALQSLLAAHREEAAFVRTGPGVV
jgi:hypothetical protein